MNWTGESHTKLYRWAHRSTWGAWLRAKNIAITTDRTRVTAPRPLYQVVKDSFQGGAKFLQPTQINVFTDGSKSTAGVGSGYVIREGRQQYDTGTATLPNDRSVHQAELLAVLLAARHLLQDIHTLRPRFVKFFVDSRSALAALCNRRHHSVLVQNTASALNDLARRCRSVRLVWIKAHAGHIGNEVADRIATGAALDPQTPHQGGILPPFSSLRQQIRKAIMEDWQLEWTRYDGG